MSATRYSRCPRCEVARLATVQEAKTAAADAYGNIDSGEWLKLKMAAEAMELDDGDDTLREDFVLGIVRDDESVRFKLNYRAHCTECEFSFDDSVRTVIATPIEIGSY